jgi:hypothetical protein
MKHVSEPNYRSEPVSDQIVDVTGPESAVAKFFSDPFIKMSSLQGKPVSEREYADLFLKAVNHGELTFSEYLRMLGGLMVEDVESNRPLRLNESHIRNYRKTLSEIVASPAHINTHAHTHAADSLIGRIAAIPVAAMTSNGLSVTYQIVGRDQQASLDYAFVLVLAKFAKDLRQCRLATCGKFFLVDPNLGRKKQREYCSPEHRDDRLNTSGSKRVQASRANMTAEEWRSIQAIDPGMTPQKWKAVKANRPRITPESWVGQQTRKHK